MDPFYFNSPFAEKCWIRRHKILAIIAPFLLLILFLATWLGTLGACTPKEYGQDPGPLRRFSSGALDGFAFAVFSWISFVEDWTRMSDHYWLAYPSYAVPALVFLFARRNLTAIVAYVLFCILVCVALFSGLGLLARLMP